MAINFPTSLDDSSTLPDPGSGSLVSVVDHALLHDSENAAIKALEAKVGTGAATPTSTNILRGNGTGTSTWGKLVLTTDVTGTLPAANGGTGVTTSTGSGNNVLSTGPTTSGGTFGGSPAITTPTITTPTIADFTNSNHDHTNAVGGGNLNGTNAITAATVNDARLIYGKVRSRQGGSTTNWQTTGTTTYDYSATNTFIQTGSIACTSGAVTVTFPTAFNQIPVVYANTSSAGSVNSTTIVKSITATNFVIYQLVVSTGAGATTETANWIAVGQ